MERKCGKCYKTYASRQSLWNHRKICGGKKKSSFKSIVHSKAVIFPNTVEEGGEETVLSWQQLPTKVWFRITAQKDIHKKNGEDVKILDLLREGGAICRVWTTATIACKIEERRVPDNFPGHLYIQSIGKTESHMHAERSYYNCILRYH